MARTNKSERVAQALNAAIDCHRQGQLAEAVRLYRQILRRLPGHADALHLCGMAQFQNGDADAGAGLVAKAIARDPGNAAYRYTLGEIRQARGEFEAALRCYQKAIERDPQQANAHYQCGSVLLELGRYPEAVACLRQHLQLRPDDVDALNNLGNALEALGELEAAIRNYRAAAEQRANDAHLWANLGGALAAHGERAEAEAALRRALQQSPGLLTAALSLAELLEQSSRPAAALELLLQQLELHAGDPGALADIGSGLLRLQAYPQAERLFRDLLAQTPEDPTATAGLANCLQGIGQLDEATALHSRVATLRPDFGPAQLALANSPRFEPDAAHRERLRAQAADESLDAHTRAQLYFALGRFAEREKDTDNAFAAYAAGNQLRAREQPFDPAEYHDLFARIRTLFDQAYFAAHRDIGVASERPVFILGMPRSGSTLVEQIISAHPQAFGAGELPDFRYLERTLASELGSPTPFPECARALAETTAKPLAERYLHGLEARAPGALRVTDKLPFNFVCLGLIATLLPHARIIHTRRDPADTCLSCYFQLFAEGMSFAYDLTGLGQMYRLYAELMAHWRQVLPLPILDVDYERLVADQEAESRRILEFIDLPWDERCLAFHRAERGVRTASAWQVRQPLYRSAVAKWRAYADHLEPLLAALGPLAPDAHH